MELSGRKLWHWRMGERLTEVWKEVEGYPGYEVSNRGRVRSYYKNLGGKDGFTLAGEPQSVREAIERGLSIKDMMKETGKSYGVVSGIRAEVAKCVA